MLLLASQVALDQKNPPRWKCPQLNPQLPRWFVVIADRRDTHFGYLTPNRSPSPVLGSASPTPSWLVPPHGWWHLGRQGHRDVGVCLESDGRECCLPATHGLAGGLGIPTACGLVSPHSGWWLRQSWASRRSQQPQEMGLDSLRVFSGAPSAPEDQAGRSGEHVEPWWISPAWRPEEMNSAEMFTQKPWGGGEGPSVTPAGSGVGSGGQPPAEVWSSLAHAGFGAPATNAGGQTRPEVPPRPQPGASTGPRATPGVPPSLPCPS